MTVRRELASTVVACAGAAGVALFAVSRTWLTDTVVKTAPLPSVVTEHSGAALVPALPALALVALAGAGGLLATRSVGRRVVAGIVALAGIGLTVLAAANVGRPAVAVGWVLLTVIAGVVVGAAGAFAYRRGGRWPGLGARYESPVRSTSTTTDGSSHSEPTGAAFGGPRVNDRTGGSDQVDGPVEPSGEIASQDLWDAIERGEDPTKS